MRVSELAKELGYKAAELVELAKHRKIEIADARAELNARVAAAVRAAVPHRSKLAGTPLMEVYARVVSDEAAEFNMELIKQMLAPQEIITPAD